MYSRYLKVVGIIYAILLLVVLTNFGLDHTTNLRKLNKPLGNGYSVLAATVKKEEPENVVYGFLPYWTIHKSEHFQLDKLTDIAYFALNVNADGSIRKLDEEGNIDPGYNVWKNSEELEQLISDAKEQNVRFALTLISHEDDVTREFLNCRSCWDKLANAVTYELESKKITDVNMDFELVEPDAEEGLSLKYSQLVNFLNNRLDRKFGSSFIVTSTLPDSMYRPRLTDIETLSNASDALFVMAYDFHRPTSDNAGPVAPINGAGTHAEYDISTMLEDYLEVTAANKLVLGVPYYGYNWLVSSPSDYAERIKGTDVLGYSISQTYSAITETKLKYQPEINWDELGQVPYFSYFNPEYGTYRQVYYENEDSLRFKYKLAKDNNLAGVGIWALGYDGGYQELWQLLEDEFYNPN